METSDYTMRVLTPGEGYILTQSADVDIKERIFSTKVYMDAGSDTGQWREMPLTEARTLMRQQQALVEAELAARSAGSEG